MLLECARLGRSQPRHERRVIGMCAFELIIDALDGAVDDMNRRHDCMACSSEAGVWTRHTWQAWHIKCRKLIDGSKFRQERRILRVVVIEVPIAEPDSTCHRTHGNQDHTRH